MRCVRKQEYHISGPTYEKTERRFLSQSARIVGALVSDAILAAAPLSPSAALLVCFVPKGWVGSQHFQDCSDVSSSKDDVDQSKQKYSVTCHHFLYCSDVSR
jgi:hypothetical protein